MRERKKIEKEERKKKYLPSPSDSFHCAHEMIHQNGHRSAKRENTEIERRKSYKKNKRTRPHLIFTPTVWAARWRAHTHTLTHTWTLEWIVWKVVNGMRTMHMHTYTHTKVMNVQRRGHLACKKRLLEREREKRRGGEAGAATVESMITGHLLGALVERRGKKENERSISTRILCMVK